MHFYALILFFDERIENGALMYGYRRTSRYFNLAFSKLALKLKLKVENSQ